MRRLLLLDDEPNILKAVRRCLSSLVAQDEFADLIIESFTSASAALARIEDEDFDLIMSDFRMPEMSGVQFLSRALEVQPQVGRMIMSAYADRDSILAAINQVQVTRFVCKPWNDDELCQIVADALTAQLAKKPMQQGDSSEHHRRINRRLEDECPGITVVDHSDDGGIDFFSN
jgi:two-component system, probable response regulator PhcQ